MRSLDVNTSLVRLILGFLLAPFLGSVLFVFNSLGFSFIALAEVYLTVGLLDFSLSILASYIMWVFSFLVIGAPVVLTMHAYGFRNLAHALVVGGFVCLVLFFELDLSAVRMTAVGVVVAGFSWYLIYGKSFRACTTK
jgi:hypothetical protein